jgi:hypothetical protein
MKSSQIAGRLLKFLQVAAFFAIIATACSKDDVIPPVVTKSDKCDLISFTFNRTDNPTQIHRAYRLYTKNSKRPI